MGDHHKQLSYPQHAVRGDCHYHKPSHDAEAFSMAYLQGLCRLYDSVPCIGLQCSHFCELGMPVELLSHLDHGYL